MLNTLVKLVFLTTLLLVQSCKEMSSLTSSGIKKTDANSTDTGSGIDDTSLILGLSGPALLVAGQCRPYIISLENSSKVKKNSKNNLLINLSGEGATGIFYSGTSCAGSSISSVTIPTGSSFISFSYRNTAAEYVSISAEPADISSVVQPGFYNVEVSAITSTVPTQLVLTGPSAVTAGACSGPVVVKTVDSSFNSAANSLNLPLTISGGAGFSIFSDAACMTTLTTPSIALGYSSTSFYFITANAGNFVIAADDSGSLTDGSLSVQATATAGTSAVKFTLTGPASIKAQECSSAFVVKTTNGSGLESPVNATTVVNLTGKGGGDFFADSGCTSILSALTFASGDSNKSFYYKGASVANLIFNVDDAGPLTPASASVAIVADVATKLIITGPSPVTIGECRAYTVTSQDVHNFISTVNSTTSVNLTGPGAGSYYSDSSCVQSTSSVIINSGQGSALFYYKATSAGSPTLSADNSGALTTGTFPVVVNPLPYTKVVFTRPLLVAGTCTPVTISLKDSLNNSSNATSSVGVTLASNNGAAFYSASNCLIGSLITSTTIASGQSSAIVYVKDNLAEIVALSASSTGLSADSWNATVSAGVNSSLHLVGPSTNPVGSCVAYDLKIEDALGNLSSASTTYSVNFTGLLNSKFYSDVNCTAIASSIAIPAGSSLAQVYLKGNVAEGLMIGASAGSLISASKSVSLIGGSSNKLVINGAVSALAGTCSALLVEVQDNFNNPSNQSSALTITLSGNGSGSYYSNAGCTTPASTVIIASGSAGQTVYFKSNIPASLSLTAQGAGLFDGTKNFAINPLAPTKLVMTGATSITSGVCTPYSISLQDTLNNLSSSGNAKTLNFSGAALGSFYTDSSCSLSAASISLASNQTTAQIFYKASAAQTVNLTVDDSGLPDLVASILPVTVSSGGGANATIALKINGSTSINSNTCVPYTMMTTDLAGQSYNVSSAMTVTMAGEGAGVFYSDNNCTTSSPTVTIASGSSLAYTYYKNGSAQNLVFSATASGASASTLPVAVVSGASGAASRLTIAGSTSILTNSCIPYLISVADSVGNSMNATATTAITLGGKGLGDFYTDDICSISAAGTTSVASGSSYTTIYYKNASPQNLIFIAQSAGLSNGTLSVGISSTSGGSIAGPAVKLGFVAQPSAVASTSENFAIQPIVTILDSNNNVASSASNTITLAAFTDSACTLSAGSILQATTNPMNAAGGVANYAGVNITSTQIVYIRASSPGLASACSSAVQVYPSVAAKLAFTTQPSTSGTAGVSFAIQPRVSILNYTNQVVTNATNSVTIAAFADSTCTTPVSGSFNVSSNNLIPASGVATFSGMNYSLASTVYFKATSSGLTSACSSGVTVNPGVPYQIGIYSQPATTGRVGENFSLTARLYDSFGNLSLDAHNILLTAYKSNNCTGATTAITGGTGSTTLGTIVFPSIVFSEANTMSLKITDTTNGSVGSACSTAIVVDGGVATKLSLSVQPSSAGRIFTSLPIPPVIRIEDSLSNLVKGATNSVTIAAFTDAGCTVSATGTLSASNLTLNPSAGIASFSSVAYTKKETIYLKASSSGLTSVCSNAIVLGGLPAKVAVRGSTTCSVSNGSVWCWGDNTYGKLGDNTTVTSSPYPVQVVGVGGVGFLTNITDVSIAENNICALSTSGEVYCWGSNANYQLGDGTTTTRLTPTPVLGTSGTGTLTNIVSISTSSAHTCAVNSSGNVFCWGANGHGQLGDTAGLTKTYPYQVKDVGGSGALSGIISVTTGSVSTTGYTCAVSSTGAAYCWGYNGYGQLGDNTTTARSAPVQVTGVGGVSFLTDVASISAGYGHNTCATTNAGAAYCWGLNDVGQLGDNTVVNRNAPVQVKGVGGVSVLGNVASINTSGGNTCAVTTSGLGYCWGVNSYSSIGDNTAVAKSAPVQILGVGGVSNLTDLISISVSNMNTCALTNDGSMYCWGNNQVGQIGDQTLGGGAKATPIKVKDAIYSLFSSVSTGDKTSCGILREKVYCWGTNNVGQLGVGDNSNRNVPTLVSTLSGVKEVSVGSQHTCALLRSGKVYCWGYNNYGQLGNNSTTNSAIPVQVNGPGGVGILSDVTSISAGLLHSCAVNGSGNAYCWGYNGSNQLGTNNTINYSVPTQVIGLNTVGYLSNVSMISAGSSHTCAVSSTASAYCWGLNSSNQIGDGTTVARPVAVEVSGLSSGVTSISAGYLSTCAIKNNSGFCWGNTSSGGNGSGTLISATPLSLWGSGVTNITAGGEVVCAVVNQKIRCYNASGSYTYNASGSADALKDIISVSTTKNYGYPTMCGLRSNGVIYCWGYDANTSPFQAGTINTSSVPTVISIPVVSGNLHTSVASGETHSCGILNGITQCWGASSSGALGSGLFTSLTPKPVLLAASSTNLGGQLNIGVGASHSCSLSYSGEVYCWGDNTFGRLGNNTTTATTKAVQVVGLGGAGALSGANALAVGYRHTCAIAGGFINCWGNNSQGQLGTDSTLSTAAPSQVKGVGGIGYLTAASQIAAGRTHTCALKSGNVFCWGNNQYGQLGANSSISQSNTPVQVVSISGIGVLDNVTSIVAGAYHTCALAGGIPYCWGANAQMQLGNDSTQDASYPVGVINSGYVTLTGVTSISAGAKHSCAITSIGEIFCWGAGSNGQLGSNSTVDLGVATNVVGVGGVGNLLGLGLGSGSSSYHTCSISSDQSSIYCWGLGSSGQIGNGSSPAIQLTPTAVSVTNQPFLIVR